MTPFQQYSHRAIRIVQKLTNTVAYIIHGSAWCFGVLFLGFAAAQYLTVSPATAGALVIAGATYRLLDADNDGLVERLLLSLGVTAPLYLLGVAMAHSMSDRVVYAIAGVAVTSGLALGVWSMRTSDDAQEKTEPTGEQEEVAI